MQPVVSTRPSSACLRRNLRDGTICTTRRRASTSLQARMGNPSQTCFHTKQAARSRCVSHADLPPSVLWHNRQTEACLVLRPKPKNRRGDFKDQITKPELPVLRPKPGNPPPPWFLGSTKKPTAGFEAKLGETVATSFEAKPAKTVRVVLRPNHSQTVDLGFEDQPRNPRS
jgi:hypothetical protein